MTTTQSGPGLGWQRGYCSPECTTDADCGVEPINGSCALGARGNSFLVGYESNSGDRCTIHCLSHQDCPHSLDCVPGGVCDGNGDGDDLTCAPCSTAGLNDEGTETSPAPPTPPADRGGIIID